MGELFHPSVRVLAPPSSVKALTCCRFPRPETAPSSKGSGVAFIVPQLHHFILVFWSKEESYVASKTEHIGQRQLVGKEREREQYGVMFRCTRIPFSELEVS